MKRIVWLIWIILLSLQNIFFHIGVIAQSVQGTITDLTSNNPIKDVNVYLMGTMQGCATDDEGHYYISNIPSGDFIITVSHIGYITQQDKVHISPNDIIKDYYLEKKSLIFPEIVISGENVEWRNNLSLFKDEFIGTLANSSQTNILNPYIINFLQNEHNWLTAEAKEGIQIRNDALGYYIEYFLDYFETHNGTTKYSGQPFFRELKPKSKDLQNYELLRKKSYCGSMRHFFYVAVKQLFIDSAKESSVNFNDSDAEDSIDLFNKHGFEVFLQGELEPDELINPTYTKADVKDFLAKDSHNRLLLNFSNYLRIHYNREPVDKNCGNEKLIFDQPQISWIELTEDSVYIDETGYNFEPYKIHTYGYWSYDRAADMLPYEYTLSDSILEDYGKNRTILNKK